MENCRVAQNFLERECMGFVAFRVGENMRNIHGSIAFWGSYAASGPESLIKPRGFIGQFVDLSCKSDETQFFTCTNLQCSA